MPNSRFYVRGFFDVIVLRNGKRIPMAVVLWVVAIGFNVSLRAEDKVVDETTGKLATLRLQFVCYQGLLESYGILKEITGGDDKLSVIDSSAEFIQCGLPDCAFCELSIRPPYLDPVASKIFLEDFQEQKHEYVNRLRDGVFEPRIVHVRPCIDTVHIDLPTAATPYPSRLQVSLYRHLKVPLPSSTALWGTSPWYGAVQFSLGDDEVPFPVVVQGPTPKKAWIIPRHFASISGPDGRIEIDRLPAGKPLNFQFFHPVLGNVIGEQFRVVIVKKQYTNKNGQVELTLNEGINDFGRIDISDALIKSLVHICP